MAKIKVDNYTFDKTAKTVTFTDYVTIRLDSILLITNVTVDPHVIIYMFAPPVSPLSAQKGGTVATNVLTLTYDTSAMSNTDKLQIFYQDESVSLGSIIETAPATDTASSGLNGRLQRIAQRITSFIALLPSSLTGSGNLKVANQEALPAGTNAIGKLAANSGVIIGDVNVVNSNVSQNVAQINGVTPLMGNGVTGTGSQRVTIANDNSDIPVKLQPQTSGGLTVYHLASATGTNATVVKASAGQLFGWYIYNTNAAFMKVAFHNTASTPTAGASLYFAIIIPPSSGANVFTDTGIAFSTGIAITLVSGAPDSSSSGVTANDLIVNLFFK